MARRPAYIVKELVDAVHQANQAFYRAFESLDLARMDEVWSHEGAVTCVHPGWPLVEGWPAVRRTWEEIFANTTEIRFDVSDERIDVGGELAWVVCTERIATRRERPTEGATIATNVFRLEEGVWRLAHHHATPFVAPQPRLDAAKMFN
jgi:ketosteroid isomerase-like protein